MKSNKAVLIILCIMMCTFCVQLFAQEATPPDMITLEYKFVKNDTTRYKLVLDMNANIQMDVPAAQQIPPMAVKIVLVMSQKVIKVLENGDAEISPKIESIKMTMMGATNEIPIEKAPLVTMVMSKTGVLKSVSGIDKTFSGMLSGIPMLNSGTSGPQLNILPDKPIGVGDSWIQDIPGPFGGKIHSECKLLEKDAKAGNYTVVVYSQDINGDLKFDMPTIGGAAQTAMPLPLMGMNGKFDYKGTGKFSTELGKMISSGGSINMQIDMNAPASPGASAQPIKILVDGAFQMYIMPPAAPARKK